jgi:uncharacterized protein
MKPSLVDANAWLALLAPRHVRHEAAKRWFASLAAGEAGLCRMVEMSLIRLLGNPAVMGAGRVSPAHAWNFIQQLAEDERVEFLAEPSEIESQLTRLLRTPVAMAEFAGAAYLAAFALATSRALVTAERGFRQFRGLDVQLLE